MTQTFTVPAGATGTTVAGTISGLPNGATCTVSVTATGDDPAAELVASSVVPAIATVPAAGTAVSVVTNEYEAPAPTTGRYAVDVTVAGLAAGLQGTISVLAACDVGGSTAFSLPAGAPAGTYRVGTVAGVPVGAVCSVTQTTDGATADAELTGTTILPASVTISDTVLEVITVTDTYAAPTPPAGSFRVDVTIGGAAAGAQAGVTVDAVCGAAPDVLAETFTLVAGASAGTHTVGTMTDVPAGYACSATLIVDGHDANATLSASSITPASVTIVDDTVSTVTVALTYAAPVPTPTPTPSPAPGPLPATGDTTARYWWLAALLLAVGGAVASLAAFVARRHPLDR